MSTRLDGFSERFDDLDGQDRSNAIRGVFAQSSGGSDAFTVRFDYGSEHPPPTLNLSRCTRFSDGFQDPWQDEIPPTFKFPEIDPASLPDLFDVDEEGMLCFPTPEESEPFLRLVGGVNEDPLPATIPIFDLLREM